MCVSDVDGGARGVDTVHGFFTDVINGRAAGRGESLSLSCAESCRVAADIMDVMERCMVSNSSRCVTITSVSHTGRHNE